MELGRGGMATVYLAERASLDIRKLVVLKVLNVALAAHEEMRSAFRREAHLSARMNHPNVVQVFEVVEHAGQAIIVMEYLDGMPLSRVMRQSALPLNLHLDILLQALDGLHHFHELTDLDGSALNPVHRDVSPQNILVLHDGGAKVLDFGIAKLQTSGDEDQTRTGLIKGKIHYMPPEQLTGSPIDRRADIFAMGVMLWEALAGRRLWEGQKDLDVMKALARGDVPSLRNAAPSVARELEAIANRALEPDPDLRFATARDMQIALEEAIRQTVGAVRSRDIAGFMLERFAEARKEQRMRLEAVRRQPETSAFETQSGLSWVPTAWRTGEAVPAGPTEPHVQALAAEPPVARRLPYRALAWAAIGLGAACVAFMAIRSHSKAPVAVVQPVKSVQFNILVDPADAEIVLDGKVLAAGRYQGVHADTGREHRLQIRAPGRVTLQENVRFDADVVRLIRLTPAAPSAAAGDLGSPRLVASSGKPDAQGVASIESNSAQRGGARARAAATHEATPALTQSSSEALAPTPVASASAPAEPQPSASPIAAAPAPVTVPVLTSVARARQVAPKIGQDLLAVNVSADPYRIRPPSALQKVAGTLDTMVRICVDVSGGVSSVSVLKSADPALDRQISATVPRWRYRPLQDAGVAVPFCYTTRMRFVGG
jgi:serine/threonine-protein kinase